MCSTPRNIYVRNYPFVNESEQLYSQILKARVVIIYRCIRQVLLKRIMSHDQREYYVLALIKRIIEIK